MNFTESQLKIFTVNGEKPIEIQQMMQEASIRNYYRLIYKDFHRVLCIDANFKSLPYDFIEVGKHYSENGIKVPEVLVYDLENHFIIQTDGGDNDLNSLSKEKKFTELVTSSIDLIFQIQSLPLLPTIQKKGFDYERLSFESNFNITHFANFRNLFNITLEYSNELKDYFESLNKELAAYPNKVICHRDFHTRNLVVDNEDKITVIDHQDSMYGTHFYDLSSLLFDAYSPIEINLRENLLEKFIDKLKEIYKGTKKIPTNRNELKILYYKQALQRSFKALGSYFWLVSGKKMDKYKPSIPAALKNIIEIGIFLDIPRDVLIQFDDLNAEIQEKVKL